MTTPKISFAVKPQKSALDGITLYEPIDKVILDKLITSTLLRTEFINNKMTTIYHTSEKQQLEKYREMMDSTGVIPIIYSLPKDTPYGRRNPANALGLYPIRREIRHTLAEKTFYDFDVENCHPVILDHLCNAEKHECIELRDYIHNREKYLSKMIDAYGCTRDDAKVGFIMWSYGAGFKKWITIKKIIIDNCHRDYVKQDGTVAELPEIRKFRFAMKVIHAKILTANPDLEKIVKTNKKKKGL